MTDIASFESALKAIVQAKHLSASKMQKLTADAMQLLEHDAQLVSILARTHKSLSGSHKIFSLYVIDSVARAARSKAKKEGSAGFSSSGGNASSFLTKLQTVLNEVFREMVSGGVPEGKEKANKVLDIWSKGNTFPTSVLSGLMATVSANPKESDVAKSSDPRIRSASTPTGHTPPNAPLAPSVQANAASASTPPVQAPPAPAAADAQAALLALLTQAAAAKQQPSTQTPTNNTPPGQAPHLGAALLQQLGLAAQHNNIPPQPYQQPQPGFGGPNGAYPYASTSQSPPYEGNGPYGRREYGQDQSRSPNDGGRPYEAYAHNDRGGGRGRGFRGGFRGRGRGEGRGGRWDDRSRPRDWTHAPRRSSRSRSPPGRYGGGGAGGRGRDVRPYSPPHRPSLPQRSPSPRRLATPETGKDEFGRDIRSPTPVPPSATPAGSSQDGMKDLVATPPAPAPQPISTVPMSPSVPANIPSAPAPTQPQLAQPQPQLAHPHPLPQPAQTTPQAAQASPQPQPTQPQPHLGIDSFDPTTFDFTAPESWAALGQLWQTTYGVTPSGELLMQFVMEKKMQAEWAAAGGMGIGGMGMGQQAIGQQAMGGMGMGIGQGMGAMGMGQGMGGADMGGQAWRGGARGGRGGFRGRGNGRGGFVHNGQAGFSHNGQAGFTHGGAGQFTHSAAGQSTDAIVLGGDGGDTSPPQAEASAASPTSGGGPGGRMQKVGDKWMFVRQPAAA
ncbi:hypothetical protein EV122DRAFT_293739 [Schizophyllum commune]